MRDYLRRNFVSEGMCVDFAINDSENDKHQRNLHCHIMLTVRPMDGNGKWQEVKEKKEYALDENGERIPVIDKETGPRRT
ncbi:MAG: MobA/MobL family protein [Lachnospiraceae bacterium]|nr:MobA/MobL family protein [Lachnospiraceae bacterium]